MDSTGCRLVGRGILHIHRRENLNSYVDNTVLHLLQSLNKLFTYSQS
jgi:hypothetical protein